MHKQTLIAFALTSVLVSGCSTTPRAFTPQLAAAPADGATYEQVLADCRIAAAPLGGKRYATKVAAGAGTAAVGSATAGGAAWGASAAVGAAAVVAVPVVGLVWGISRIERGKKESRIKKAEAECLSQQGYEVAGWERVKGKPGKQVAEVETVPEL
ncbi:hypothetical protein GRI89_17710 [Altererythrobacter salegens]|uniref:Glycine zipper family protein n=1 Tax=Croceibacterium salegens TaxID=1737568 RepID=A0A6I4T3N2_9SPHN|nr:hypothetical protein [Croceibacterium salegens]MXO61382.1 hypothetical protein [Croceibacterium salegens]